MPININQITKNVMYLYKRNTNKCQFAFSILGLLISLSIYLYMVSRKSYYLSTSELNKELILQNKEKISQLKSEKFKIDRMALDYTQEIETKKKLVIYANEKTIYYNNLYDKILPNKTLEEEKLNQYKSDIQIAEKLAIEKENELNQTKKDKFESEPDLKLILHNIKIFEEQLQKNKELLEQHRLQIESLYNTKTLTTIIEIERLTSFLGAKKIFLTQIFRATEDGASGSLLRKKIKSASPTVSIVKDKNGNVFGGYTTQTWVSNIEKGGFEFKPDENAFLFSLTLNKKYPIQPTEINHAIVVSDNALCSFGFGMDIFIANNCFDKDANNYVSFPSSYGNSLVPKTEISNFNTHFEVEEFEVFHVKIVE